MVYLKERSLKTKRPTIIRAALRLFSEKGIKATTIRDIAREARVAEGTLYRHWESKEELAQELFCENMARFKEYLESELRGIKGTKERLRRAIKAFYAFAQQEPVLFKFLILTSHYELRRLLPRTPKPLDVFFDILREGIGAGEIRPVEIPLAAAFIVGAVTKLSDFQRMGIINKDLGFYIEPVTEFLWEGLRMK